MSVEIKTISVAMKTKLNTSERLKKERKKIFKCAIELDVSSKCWGTNSFLKSILLIFLICLCYSHTI